jgi:ABC-type multidrug transport system permease subunit
MSILGNDTMDIPFSYIEEVNMLGAYSLFFSDACVSDSPDNCSTYYSKLFALGTYSAVSAYSQDIAFVVNTIYNEYYDSDFQMRWDALEDIPSKSVQLNQVYLPPLLQQAEVTVNKFFRDELAFFANIRIVFLALWVVSSLVFFVFVMRRAVMWHERKKQLVREMLLLLPYPVIRSSVELQTALNSLDLS